MAGKRKTNSKEPNGATLGFEQKLWQAADALRNNMDAAEYKHVVLGLIFLKYISLTATLRQQQAEAAKLDAAIAANLKDLGYGG
jgi:type I restriction enzyme M protein